MRGEGQSEVFQWLGMEWISTVLLGQHVVIVCAIHSVGLGETGTAHAKDSWDQPI